MNDPLTHLWSPIEDLPQDWDKLRNQQLHALIAAWHSQVGELRNQDSYHNFLARLRREWAIETGVIERLYRLDEGATKALIEKGLDAALISHEETDLSPREHHRDDSRSAQRD